MPVIFIISLIQEKYKNMFLYEMGIKFSKLFLVFWGFVGDFLEKV